MREAVCGDELHQRLVVSVRINTDTQMSLFFDILPSLSRRLLKKKGVNCGFLSELFGRLARDLYAMLVPEVAADSVVSGLAVRAALAVPNLLAMLVACRLVAVGRTALGLNVKCRGGAKALPVRQWR